ncbi:MAG: tetratricopeptide repeat protein [archaeon]|nr:tetratricopeptide repeat protein [archaeon]
MSAPEGYFQFSHGKLTVNVPRNLYVGLEAEYDAKKQADFGRILKSRYPWLSDGSLEVFFRNARFEYLRLRDLETGGLHASKRMEEKGDIEGAIRHIREKLEEDPEDADSWYALGNLLCKAGKTEEGYKAFAKGRSLI